MTRSMHYIEKRGLLLVAATLALTACGSRDGAIDVTSGVGINVTRTGCPAVAIPDHTGDVTVFDPPASTEARAIELVANITNVRSTCNDQGERIYTEATFDVFANRTDARGAQTVTLPYFATVVQGGTAVVSKRVNQVTLQFADGATRAQASAKAASYVDAASARLPEEVIERLTKRRKAGDADAALDPLADPAIRDAVARSTFELLIGFQLTPQQLQYNATR